jgi:23S rRNA U2552 (ribose-2'-O)-methylase RlmE/FtsJ
MTTKRKSHNESNTKTDIVIDDIINNHRLPDSNLSKELYVEIGEKPLAIKLTYNTSILSTEGNISFSSNINYPRFEYGFHHHIHASKNKLTNLKKFEGKKKVYDVFHKYDMNIDEYDDSIGQMAISYFNLKNKSDILGSGFFDIWEIIMYFNIIDLNNKKYITAHLSEDPGSYTQATMFYRNMFSKSKDDTYYIYQLNNNDTDKSHLPKINADFLNKHKNIIVSKSQSIPQKADFITGNIGFDWINENLKEQSALSTILTQIAFVFQNQKKGGSFVCKYFETFTKSSVKSIAILNELFDNVYFVKPLSNKQYTSDKYAVCIGFKYDEKHKDFKSINKKLNDIVDKLQKNINYKISDIFTDYIIPRNFITSIIQINNITSNAQFRNLNEMIEFIEKEIYFGTVYHEKRENQINSAKYWNNLFYPNIKDFSVIKKMCENIMSESYAQSLVEEKELFKKLQPVSSQ